jgi:hypothetical protein
VKSRREFFGVDTPAEYERLPEAEVFARVMRGLTKNAPQMAEMFKSVEMNVLGSVAESPDLTHVLYRSTIKMADVPVAQMAVISFKRDGTQWRALLTGDLEAMMSGAMRSAESLKSTGSAPARRRRR